MGGASLTSPPTAGGNSPAVQGWQVNRWCAAWHRPQTRTTAGTKGCARGQPAPPGRLTPAPRTGPSAPPPPSAGLFASCCQAGGFSAGGSQVRAVSYMQSQEQNRKDAFPAKLPVLRNHFWRLPARYLIALEWRSWGWAGVGGLFQNALPR